MYTKILPLLTVASLLCFSCNQKPKKALEKQKSSVITEPAVVNETLSTDKAYVLDIEKAHKKTAFLEKQLVSFDMKLSFGSKHTIDCKISMLTNTSKLRIDNKDGSSFIFDGSKLYATPEDTDTKGARFGIFTWSYFFALPYKLSDSGVHLAIEDDKKLNDKNYHSAKLTFDKNVGDAPDDWYILFNDPKTLLLHAASYIVTYGKNGNTAKAEEDPHAIVYSNYTDIDGIPIATDWKFYGWRANKGLTEQLGAATLSNITFTATGDHSVLFKKPANSKLIE